jgi:hypothetical protein
MTDDEKPVDLIDFDRLKGLSIKQALLAVVHARGQLDGWMAGLEPLAAMVGKTVDDFLTDETLPDQIGAFIKRANAKIN